LPVSQERLGKYRFVRFYILTAVAMKGAIFYERPFLSSDRKSPDSHRGVPGSSPARSCWICGGQSCTGAGFLRVLRFPLPVIPPTAAYSSSSTIRGWYSSPVAASVLLDLIPLDHSKNKESSTQLGRITSYNSSQCSLFIVMLKAS
jgi:hypothetical protein